VRRKGQGRVVGLSLAGNPAHALLPHGSGMGTGTGNRSERIWSARGGLREEPAH
jgi:hypothetical protein